MATRLYQDEEPRFIILTAHKNLVSVARIELALHAPKARVIPFHYTEKTMVLTSSLELDPPRYEGGIPPANTSRAKIGAP